MSSPAPPCFPTRFGRIAAELYVLLMLSVYPLFTGPDGYIYLQLDKYLFFLAATTIWFVLLTGLFIAWLVRSRHLPRMTTTAACLLAFAALALISTLTSTYGVFFTREIGRYDSLSTYYLYGIILLSVAVIGVNPLHCLYAFTTSYTVCCGIALLQLFGRNPFSLFPDGLSYLSPAVQETGAFLGTVGNVDVFSALHCLALPLFAGVLCYGKRPRRWLLILPLLLGAAVQLAADVSAGILAELIVAVLVLPTGLVRRLSDRRPGAVRPWMYFSGAIILAVALAAWYWIPFPSGAAYELHEILHGNLDNSFGSHRILIWRETTAVLRKHLLLGIGPDTLQYYLPIRFERYSEVFQETVVTTVQNAHSAPLQLLVSFGLLGFIPLSVLLTNTFALLLPRLHDSAVCRIMVLPFLCYLVQSLFNLGTCIVVPMFLILWGMILYECRAGEKTNCALS